METFKDGSPVSVLRNSSAGHPGEFVIPSWRDPRSSCVSSPTRGQGTRFISNESLRLPNLGLACLGRGSFDPQSFYLLLMLSDFSLPFQGSGCQPWVEKLLKVREGQSSRAGVPSQPSRRGPGADALCGGGSMDALMLRQSLGLPTLPACFGI